MAFTKTTFSIKELLKQFKNDLWCKEVETGYTVSYTWMANQLGHFALGFVPTILIMTACFAIWGLSPWFALLALLPISMMVGKEYGDVQAEVARWKGTPGIEPLAIADVWKNAANACWFSVVGALVAGSCALAPLLPVALGAGIGFITLFLLTIPTLFVMRYWITKKKCYQQSGLPYIYRLSYFDETRIIGDQGNVRHLLSDFQNAHIDHLVISGPVKSGKTTLAVGLGTELGFDQIKVRYTSFMDFTDLTQETEEEYIHLAYILWNWKDAEVLIFDDVKFADVSNFISNNPGVLALMKEKKIVWITEEDPIKLSVLFAAPQVRTEQISLKSV